MAKKTESISDLHVAEINMTSLEFFLVGTSPLVLHAMSAKGKAMILFPTGRKNAADRASSMKHEPFEEYRDAAYAFRDEDRAPTRLYMPASSFHTAIADAALDITGASKAQIGRLTRVPGDKIPIYGVPQIFTMLVRSSDMRRTPDIRTLPALPRWACKLTVMFPAMLIKPQSIANLFGSAGIIVGVGDGRPQKAKKEFGCWRLCSENDPEWNAIVSESSIKAQDEALANPEYFDRESEQLLTWFIAERERRVAQPPKAAKAAPTRARIANPEAQMPPPPSRRRSNGSARASK